MAVSFADVVCERMTTALPARRPSAGAVPGRRGACLAVRPHRPPTWRLRSQVVGTGAGVSARAPSEFPGRDDLAAVAGHQSGKDADADVGPQEAHRAVGEHDV